ncbi:MAG: nuclear transport factor 2 family protein [Microthrixaceae bacterium]
MTELTSAQLEQTCTRYIELVGSEDLDAMMDLFADNPSIEDPVGSERLEGRDAVRGFYASLPDAGVTAKLTGPVCTVPDARSAAFPFDIDTAGLVMSVIDVMTFDDDGKVTSMTAYWKM